MNLQVKFLSKGTTLIVSILGELDHHSAEYIRQKVDSEIIKATTKNIIFDFSKVTFMDSSGIGVILGRYKNVQKINGKTSIANVNSQIKRIFEMSGLFKIIPVYDNLDIAINKM
ncbi:MAG: anti-sigma F factor antagonist [Clostridia bacterium]|nr:anti-sigma F factor antagonist [Clostridia bacterium]